MFEPGDIMMGHCEFCGKYRKLASTTIVCNYCAACHRLVIKESQEALEELLTGKAPTCSKSFPEFDTIIQTKQEEDATLLAGREE